MGISHTAERICFSSFISGALIEFQGFPKQLKSLGSIAIQVMNNSYVFQRINLEAPVACFKTESDAIIKGFESRGNISKRTIDSANVIIGNSFVVGLSGLAI